MNPEPAKFNILYQRDEICALGELLPEYIWHVKEAGSEEFKIIENATSQCFNVDEYVTGLFGRVEENQFELTAQGVNGNRIGEMSNPHTITDANIAEILSIETSSFTQLSVFPNVTSGQFAVKLGLKKATNVQTKLVNSLGTIIYFNEHKNVSSEFVEHFDISAFPTGIYFLHIETADGSVVKKIIRK